MLAGDYPPFSQSFHADGESCSLVHVEARQQRTFALSLFSVKKVAL